MRVEYRPKRDSNYAEIPGIEVAHSVIFPDDYPGTNKSWPWMMSTHGVGERGGGTLKHLQSLVNGDDYNADGKIDARYLTEGMKEAVDKYGLVIVIVTYEDKLFFDPNKAKWVYEYVTKKYSLMSLYWKDGFSYGGGATLNAITSPLTAPNIVFATPCSPTRHIGNISLIKQYNIVTHLFVNDKDFDNGGATSLEVTKKIVSDINNTNPQIKAQYTGFNRSGHSGSHEAATTIAPPKATDGQGFKDAGENVFELFFDILKNGPRQMKSGTIINPLPIETETTPPVTTLQPVLEHKIIGNTVYLDGSKSTGMKSAKLAAVAVPDGVNIYTASIEGGGSAVGKISLTTPGVYKFRLTIYPEVSYKGTPAEKDVEVTYGEVSQPEPFKPTHTIVRADGTKEQVRIETL